MATNPAIEVTELRQLYDALPAFPDFPGEREWPMRLMSFEDFLDMGPDVAKFLVLPNPYAEENEQDRLRGMFPELWDLLFRAFPVARGT